MSETTSHTPARRRLWFWLMLVAAAVAIGLAFVPQKRSQYIVIDALPNVSQNLEVFVNGTRVGLAPVRIEFEDAFTQSIEAHVPANWPASNLTVTQANHTRSGTSLFAGTDLSIPGNPGAPHVVVFREEGSKPADTRTGAIEVRVQTEAGAACRPETMGATITSWGPRWNTDLRVLFAPVPTPPGP